MTLLQPLQHQSRFLLDSNFPTLMPMPLQSGTKIVIHTFNYYVQNAVNSLKAKGAIPIVSSQTPNNAWTGTALSPPSRFVGYAQLAGSRTNVTYVDHWSYVAQSYQSLGQTTVNTYYPNDHTHTSAAGANVVAQAFVRGITCGKSALAARVNDAGKNVYLAGEWPPRALIGTSKSICSTRKMRLIIFTVYEYFGLPTSTA